VRFFLSFRDISRALRVPFALRGRLWAMVPSTCPYRVFAPDWLPRLLANPPRLGRMTSTRSFFPLVSWSHSLRAVAALGLLSLGAGCDPEAASTPPAVSQASQPLVGGTSASAGEFPWMVSIQDTAGNHLCGGTIINSVWVLTSRQCVLGTNTLAPTHPNTLRVAAGSNNLSTMSTAGQVRQVQDVVPLEGSWDATQGRDLALLRLVSALTLNGTTVAALPVATAADASAGYTAPGVIATLSGWGQTAPGSSTPDALGKMSVPLVSNAAAATALGQPVTADQLGADGSAQGNAFCAGDVGGPLVVDGVNGKKLVGVASYNVGCSAPDMFTGVSSYEWFFYQVSSKLRTTNRMTKYYVSAPQGGWHHAYMYIPSNTPVLTVGMAGGTGNGMLYMRHTSQPTQTTYACRSESPGNLEYCVLHYPTQGYWYVSVYGETAVSNITLTANTFY
jgi:hypothetical protein